jgi:hypothetical protein
MNSFVVGWDGLPLVGEIFYLADRIVECFAFLLDTDMTFHDLFGAGLHIVIAAFQKPEMWIFVLIHKAKVIPLRVPKDFLIKNVYFMPSSSSLVQHPISQELISDSLNSSIVSTGISLFSHLGSPAITHSSVCMHRRIGLITIRLICGNFCLISIPFLVASSRPKSVNGPLMYPGLFCFFYWVNFQTHLSLFICFDMRAFIRVSWSILNKV